jgi:hypothetical protein
MAGEDPSDHPCRWQRFEMVERVQPFAQGTRPARLTAIVLIQPRHHHDSFDFCGGSRWTAGVFFLGQLLQIQVLPHNVLESLGRLRESPDYELCRITEQKAGVLDELAAQRAEVLDKESAELEEQANRLAKEIVELGGEIPSRIA